MVSNRSATVFISTLALAALSGACGSSQQKAPRPVTPINKPQAKQSDDGTPAKRIETAKRLIQTKTFGEAKRLLESALADEPGNAEAHFFLAVTAEEMKDPEGARSHYAKALELDPKLSEAAQNLSALLINQGDFQGALVAVDRGLAADANNLELKRNRALALQNAGKLEEALVAYEELQKADPKEIGYSYEHALILGELSAKDPAMREKALAEWDKLMDTKDPNVLAAMAKPLAKLEAYEKCVTALDKALEIKKDPEFFVRRGLCRQSVKPAKPAAEIADYQSALELKPEYVPARYYLGLALWKNKDGAKAKAELEQVVASGAEPFVKKAKAKIEEIDSASQKTSKKK